MSFVIFTPGLEVDVVQVFLEPRLLADDSNSAENGNWIDVARLLGRKHHIIEPLHALSLVPEEVSKDRSLTDFDSKHCSDKLPAATWPGAV